MSMEAAAIKTKNPIYRRIVLGVLWLGLLYGAFRIFPYIIDLVVVVIIAVVMNYIFRPLVGILERRGIHRVVAITLIFAILLGLIVLLLNSLVPSLIEEIGSLSSNLEALDFEGIYVQGVEWLNLRIPGLLKLFGLDTTQAGDVMDRVAAASANFLRQSVNILASAANILSLSIVVPFLLFFMLKDGDKMTRALIRRVPNRFFEMTMSLANRVDNALGNYIRSVLIESSIVGLLVWGGLGIVGVRFALILGIINGFLNMIPFFGPLIAYIPTAIVILITFQPIGWGLFWMVVVLIVAQALDNILLKPLLISRSTNVHPATVLLVVLIGGRVAGAVGMFVAVPVYSIIQIIVLDLYDHLKKYRIV